MSNSAIDHSSNLPGATWRDYYQLTKPKVVYQMLITALVGMFMAVPGMVPWEILVFGNIGIGLCAASAAVVNQLVDQRIDAEMLRTINRPIPQGLIDTRHAVMFALILGLAGLVMLITLVNPLTAWLTLFSLVGYALIYTLYLKRATPQNIVIGGLAGAAPPLLGWVAVTNEIHPHALLLVLIVFTWTPPHFWSLAIHRRDEYAKVNIPMLPVTHGIEYTRLHILLYTFMTFAATLMPFATHMSGPLYLVGALLLGIGLVYGAIKVMIGKDKTAPMANFKYSNIYLIAIFIVMLADHYIFPPVSILQFGG
jgi:protoheme IX farnesyltransferase